MKNESFIPDYSAVDNGIYPDDFFSYPAEYRIDNFSHMASVGLCDDISYLCFNMIRNWIRLGVYI